LIFDFSHICSNIFNCVVVLVCVWKTQQLILTSTMPSSFI
jgi:hypothetical protein